MELSTPIEEIPRIGPVYQKKLRKLGIKIIQDLLFHFPNRYQDFSKITPISNIKVGEVFCVQGKILEIKNTRTWRKRMFLTQAILEDKTAAVKSVWFNQPYLTNALKEGNIVYLAGKVAKGKGGTYLQNPTYEKLSGDLTHTGRIIPVYPETEGLSSRWLRFILKPLLNNLRDKIFETLPDKILGENQIMPLKTAVWQVHFPDSLELAKKAKDRFSFEELFNISLLVQKERQKISKEKAIVIPINLSLLKDFIKRLPFKLTDAQKKSVWQILKDLEKPRPMNRLLQGDVGSGKTVVATIAALNVVKCGFQAAFMAPTEILAKQHFKTVWGLLRDFNLNIGLLTGKENKIFSKKLKSQAIEVSRKKILEKIESGEINILIGTHALISSSAKGYGGSTEASNGGGQKQVKFGKLALVVLDEQHRFGVDQRAKLLSGETPHQNKVGARQADEERKIPHLLSMTATPIPRTLTLTIYGDLDLSLINELPKGRKKIVTEVIPPEKRKLAYGFIRKEVKKKRQVFVICPRIEPGQKNGKEPLSWAEVKAVKEEYAKLSKIVFPDLRVGCLHGKMKPGEKEKIMLDFKNKKTDILVSTSVIEVGVDVPNATVMAIEGAERFGLAQLHQFRGRVGRSEHQSFCFLFTDSPAKKTRQRLKALIDCEDGFKLAEKDLEIRGPGDFVGQRQWGIPDLVMDSLKNIFLVEKTREAAKKILTEDPQLKKYPLLKKKLEEFRKRIHLE